MKAFHLRPSSASGGTNYQPGSSDAESRSLQKSGPSTKHRPGHAHRPTTAPGPSPHTSAHVGPPSTPETNGTHLTSRPSLLRAQSSGPYPAGPMESQNQSTKVPRLQNGLTPATSTGSLRTAASEAWTNPEESEGEFVRRTYLYFDQYGVKGDGNAEGREWTRNRDAAKTPWNDLAEHQSSGSSASGSARTARNRTRTKSSPSAPNSQRRPNGLAQASTQSNGRLSPSSAFISRGTSAANGSSNISHSSRSSAIARPSPLGMPPTIPGSPHETQSRLSSDGSRSEQRATSPQMFRSIPAAQDPELPSPTEILDDADGGSKVLPPATSMSSLASSGVESEQGFGRLNTVPPSHLAEPNQASRATLSPIMAHSRLSESELSEVSEIGTEEWAEHRNLERRKRTELSTQQFGGFEGAKEEGDNADEIGGKWRKLDRYGFFAQEWASHHGRLSILPSAAFTFVPLPGAPHKGKGKAMAASRAAQNVISDAQSSNQQPEASHDAAALGDDALAWSQSTAISSLRTRSGEVTRQKEQRRIAKWGRMLEPNERKGSNTAGFRVRKEYRGSAKLTSRVTKGIPDRWRAAAWWALLEADREQEQNVRMRRTEADETLLPDARNLDGQQSETGQQQQKQSLAVVAPTSGVSTGRVARSSSIRRITSGTRSRANSLRKKAKQGSADAAETNNKRRKDPNEPLSSAILRRQRQDHMSRYYRLLGVASPHDVQIDLDVPRTISNHIQFHTRYGQGQRSLFKVLHAFSLLCGDCGYCQGMGSLTVTLLCYFPEEVAYSVLVTLHDSVSKYDLHQVFYPGFPGLMEQFHVQEQLMKLLLPSDLLQNLEEEGITTSSYATRWYITNFYNVIPFETQLRLWDLFFLLGKDVLPIFAVSILHGLGLTAFAPPGKYDFEHLMSHLNHIFIPENDDRLFEWIGQIVSNKRVIREINKARIDWRASQAGVTPN
ncbi:unnamed protein product [Sympodiomycopsis kandeliae]